MKRIVDGEWLESAEPMEELPLGAEGVFETILLRHGTPLFWAEHWQRFEAGCRFFGFAPPIESTSLAATAARLAKDNGIANGVIRFAAWKTVVRGLPPSPRLRKTGRTPPSAVPGADARSNSTKNAAFATAGYGDPALQFEAAALTINVTSKCRLTSRSTRCTGRAARWRRRTRLWSPSRCSPRGRRCNARCSSRS